MWGGQAAGAPHTLSGLPIPETNGTLHIPLAAPLHVKQAVSACFSAINGSKNIKTNLQYKRASSEIQLKQVYTDSHGLWRGMASA